jgi:uncharacterized cupredoxin-like copper-binding protein
MVTTRRARLCRCCVVLALAALAVTGCSNAVPGAPPSGGATSAVPAAPDQATICGAAVDVSKVLADGPDIGDDPLTPEQVAAAFNEYRARLEPPLTALEHNPPAVLKEDLGTLARQARFAIENKDTAAVNTEEFQAAAGRLQSYVVRNCRYTTVRVNATDYAFQGIPPTIAAGTTVFTLINRGVEPHELNLYRIDDDTPQPMAELVKLPEAQRDEVLEAIISVSTNPGSADTVFATLTPGRYGAACLEPKGSTPEKEGAGPPHATLGMVTEFTVP